MKDGRKAKEGKKKRKRKRKRKKIKKGRKVERLNAMNGGRNRREVCETE